MPARLPFVLPPLRRKSICTAQPKLQRSNASIDERQHSPASKLECKSRKPSNDPVNSDNTMQRTKQTCRMGNSGCNLNAAHNKALQNCCSRTEPAVTEQAVKEEELGADMPTLKVTGKPSFCTILAYCKAGHGFSDTRIGVHEENRRTWQTGLGIYLG
jgi:hypothetical protein